MVWIDLEMTGLDADNHRIVEIACVVTDAELRPLGDGVQCVIHQPDGMLASMEEVVWRMHERSGLLHAIRESVVGVEVAEQQVLDYVRRYARPNSAPLCGNSVGTDRRFVSKYMSRFDAYLHYRNIDVSSLKELCRRWAPEVYTGRPPKTENHRAMSDVFDSIDELRYYRERMFGEMARAAV
jgi:oligoribonuclease